MKALFIGGTGTISSSITALAAARGFEITLLNRGSQKDLPQGVKSLVCDIGDEEAVRGLIGDQVFDVVADFIAFTPEQALRGVRLFAGKCKQYFFISSASAYLKPPSDALIRESTPLHNPYWTYSQDKAACEDALMAAYRDTGFPVTIIRPSHTYCEKSIPVALHGNNGSYAVFSRMLRGKPVIIPGDGSSLWTLTHSTDFAKAFVGLMGQRKAIGEAFTITSDEQLTWDQVHQVAAREIGVSPKLYHISTDFLCACDPSLRGPLTGDKSNSVIFDNSKVKRLVPDFVCTTPFDQGVRIAWDYISKHEACMKEDPAFDAWCDKVIAAHEAGIKAFNSLA